MGKVGVLLGTAVAGIIGLAMVSGTANAAEKERGGSKSKSAPNGADFDDLAADTTRAMQKQDIAALRILVSDWKKASDPETAGAISFTLEQAVAGAELPESKIDGDKGSPILRAFGLRVLQLEGRKPRLELWAKAWKTILPVLATALLAKAKGLQGVEDHAGGAADPMPDEKTMAEVLAAVESQDPNRMRTVARKLESLGFPEAAADLRAMADLIESGKAHADSTKPAPVPKPDPTPAPLPKPRDEDVQDEIIVRPDPKPDAKPQPKPIATDRIVAVPKGYGISQVAAYVLGSTSEGNARWREMRAINVPPFKTDSKGNVILQPGDYLNVPKSWPDPKGVTIPGVSQGPRKAPKPSANNEQTAKPGTPEPTTTRIIVVNRGEGIAQVAMRARKGTGVAYSDADRKRLRDFNVPPFKKTPDGSGLVLNPGDKIRIPPEWPQSPAMVMGGDPGMNPRQLAAARVALGAHFGHDDPERLMEFQRRERLEPTGTYGPATAIILCERFGIVPACPKVWGSNERKNRAEFARRMYTWAKRDPQRADEFRLTARRAEGKAA